MRENIYYWEQLSVAEQEKLLLRPILSKENLQDKVDKIIQEVQANGDEAILRFTEQFDGIRLNSFQVSTVELSRAGELIENFPELKDSIETAISRISAYQQQLKPKNQKILNTVLNNEGIDCYRMPRPIEKVGLYVPGGTAPLLSTLMMLAIPARIAECKEIILCTPPNKKGEIHPALLYTAWRCGVSKIYKVGGVQAIAAMAFGTKSIEKTYKIFGPGNAYVTCAKQKISIMQSGLTIDMPAGPSEVMVIADASASPEVVAADLLSQAEHGVDSQVILLTTAESLAFAVAEQIEKQVIKLNRKNIIQESLQHSRMIIVSDLTEAFSIANQYASEHLILQIENAKQSIEKIKNAGAVFLGPYSAETMGDYINGPNHVLPTAGYAKNVSGLSVVDFMKFISVQQVSMEGLKKYGKHAMRLANLEGLEAHEYAVACRLEKNENNNQETVTSLVRLHANESPSLNFDATFTLETENLNRYPEQPSLEMKKMMSEFYQVTADNILLTRGSDDGIDLLIRSFCEPESDGILTCPPTFSMYDEISKWQKIYNKTVSLDEKFQIEEEKILECWTPEIKIIFLCSPNNPTGGIIASESITKICAELHNKSLVVVDEAYIEYANIPSMAQFLNQFPNLIVLRTLSKAFALASVRVGIILANKNIIEKVQKIIPPYPLSSLSIQAAKNAFEESSLQNMQKNIEKIIAERERIFTECAKMKIVQNIWNSSANFLLIQFKQPIHELCLQQGFWVRDMAALTNRKNCIRISMGQPSENNKFLDFLRSLTCN